MIGLLLGITCVFLAWNFILNNFLSGSDAVKFKPYNNIMLELWSSKRKIDFWAERFALYLSVSASRWYFSFVFSTCDHLNICNWHLKCWKVENLTWLTFSVRLLIHSTAPTPHPRATYSNFFTFLTSHIIFHFLHFASRFYCWFPYFFFLHSWANYKRATFISFVFLRCNCGLF